MFNDAWHSFRSGKNTREILEFEYNLEQNLADLELDVQSGVYRHGSYRTLEIADKKRRLLHVAAVRDRVAHRFLYDRLVQIYDPTFDSAVFSGRRGRGLGKSLHATQKLLQKYPGAFILRADIKKAFEHIDHQILLRLLRRKLDPAARDTHDPDSQIYRLCQEVIASFANDPARTRGIPIGNLTSQIFSLIYLNELDRFIRHAVKPLAYLRYGDDFIIFLPTLAKANNARAQVVDFLARDLKMTLNPKNTITVKSRHGLHFLGHIITASSLAVDKTTTARVLKNANHRNLASYKQLYLPPGVKDALDRQILAQITQEIDQNIDF